MKQLRALASAMQDEELYLLRRRSLESKASGRSALVSTTVSNSVLVAAFGLLYLLLRWGFRDRERAEADLRAAHGLLESKVKERTTELAQANDKLQAFAGELQRSNRELQDFAFVASHDLQEPLRKIQAFGDRLRSKYGDALSPEGRDYLERMQAAAQRMHVLINDLLAFSRIASKGQPFVPVDLDRIAHEVLSDLEVRVQENGGRVEVGDLPEIEADPMQMRQLLQNLIGNAFKFHRPGEPPVVRVEGRVSADERPRVTLEVSDNGIGFDSKYLDRIFTPFQRLHGRSEYEGTGMGLAVCRRIAERHGGTITATSVPGEGSTFTVELPRYQGEDTKWQPANPS
jgi:light-regulated signal transduction histidine kinase (bacteriophytochrome)